MLELIAAGCDNAEIAATLGLALKTVRNNVSAILTKLRVTHRGQAIVKARTAGMGRLGRAPDHQVRCDVTRTSSLDAGGVYQEP